MIAVVRRVVCVFGVPEKGWVNGVGNSILAIVVTDEMFIMPVMFRPMDSAGGWGEISFDER